MIDRLLLCKALMFPQAGELSTLHGNAAPAEVSCILQAHGIMQTDLQGQARSPAAFLPVQQIALHWPEERRTFPHMGHSPH